MARTIRFEFEELPLAGQALYATGFAEIEYSDTYSGFAIRDVTLDPHKPYGKPPMVTPKAERLDHEKSLIWSAIVKALETTQIEAIEQAIGEDKADRKAEAGEARYQAMRDELIDFPAAAE